MINVIYKYLLEHKITTTLLAFLCPLDHVCQRPSELVYRRSLEDYGEVDIEDQEVIKY